METLALTGTIFNPTDLRNNRKAIDAARKDGVSRIRDTDGASLLLIEEQRVSELATGQVTSDLFVRLHELELQLKDGGLPTKRGLGDWRWLSSLDRDDWEDFLADMWECGLEAFASGTAAPIENELRAWKETAAALADPERVEAATRAFDPEDYAEITPDSADGATAGR
jgi:hypothetical protein